MGAGETGEERLSEINEELKRLRKEVRMTVQIEKAFLGNRSETSGSRRTETE